MHVESRLESQTKQHGTILKWNEKGGYGFIAPRDGGSEEVFFHVSEFQPAQIIGKDVVFDKQFDAIKGKPSAINVQDAELQKMQELKDALEAREQQKQELQESLNANKKQLQQSNESHTKANEDSHKCITVYRAQQQAYQVEKDSMRQQIATLEQEALEKDNQASSCQKEGKKLREELAASQRQCEKGTERQLADEDEKQTLRVQIHALQQEARKRKALDEECARSKRQLADELQAVKKEHNKQIGKLQDRIERRHAEKLQALTKENKKLRDCCEEKRIQLLNLMKQKEPQRTGNFEHQEEKKNTQQKPQAQQHRCDQDNKDSNHDNDKLRESRRCPSVRLKERKSQGSPPHQDVHRRHRRRRPRTEQYNVDEADFGSPKS